ncbi:MAG: hemerythrin domain-containing protein [Ferruginibacter sp.]
MKRHPALIPLSREHQPALLLAQVLKKDAPAFNGMPSTLPDKAAFALKMYTLNLQGHFAKEEAMLASIKNIHASIDTLTEEICNEHQQLSNAFLALDKTDHTVEELDALGNALDDHIRKEERILFPLIQEHCSEEVLATFQLGE